MGAFDPIILLILGVEETGVYKTIIEPSEGLYKEKGSKFIAHVFHVESEEEIKDSLNQIKKLYYNARHHCYAYRLNPENEQFRSNDDGEPSGTAGKPILNQILSYELFDVLVVVVRYFGGTKLGVSGLIRAYKSATIDALEQTEVIQKTITRKVNVRFEYVLLNDVMRIIKEEDLTILKQQFDNTCFMLLEVQKNREEIIKSKFDKILGIIVN
ncbi:MAG: YigZ family protein [Bacteroidales bacterium]|nr:YigZ family protein [Bacteroidales bacterium]